MQGDTMKRTPRAYPTWLGAVCAAFVAGAAIPAGAKSPPNVVIFVADDLGWADVGFHGEEQIQTPETEVIAPAEQNNPAEVEEPEPVLEPEPVKPLGGGTTDGDTGEPEGDPGPGEDEQKTAPFNIEGLNRSTVYAPLPRNTESANVSIKVRVTVNPQGRVVRIFPVQKGDPSLERAVRDVLLRWRFNALPSNAPQVAQTGFVTFRFVAE